MNTLPNELLVLILNYQNSSTLAICYKSTKLLYHLKAIVPIQVCKIEDCYYDDCSLPYYISAITQPYEYETLPKTIRCIKFESTFRSKINYLPLLTHIVYNSNSNVKFLPITLTHLKFGNRFNQQIRLPQSLTHLIFGNDFNQPLILPKLLIYLRFGIDFNQNLPVLPKTLKHLHFGLRFTKELPTLPLLTHFTSGSQLSNMKLPHTLIYVNSNYLDNSFKIFYNSSLENVTHLILGNNINRAIDNWPPLLTHLTIGMNFNAHIENWPPLLTHLRLYYVNFSLPTTLTHLVFYCDNNNSFENLHLLTHITFDYEFNKPLNNLPSSCSHLTFDGKFNQSVDNLPLSIRVIVFGDYFDKPINDLPQVTHLTFGCDFNHPIDDLPRSLISLKLGMRFNKPLKNLPDLNHIGIGKYFNQYIDELPKSLRSIKISKNYVTIIPRYVTKIILF